MDSDSKSLLVDLTEHSAYPKLLSLLDELVKAQEQSVLNYDVHSLKPEGLIYLKCEAMGARKLRVSLEAFLKKLRVAALEA